MSVYFGKDRKCAIVTMTATYASVIGLTTRIENLGHKTVHSSHDLFDDLHKKAINFCGNDRAMPPDVRRKLRLEGGGIKPRVKGDLTVTVWKEKQNVNTLINMCSTVDSRRLR